MKKFTDKIIGNYKLVSGLVNRGYTLSPPGDDDDDDPNRCTFVTNVLTDVSIEVIISIWDKHHFQCSLIVCSKTVTDEFQKLDLFIGEPSNFENSPISTLTVDLLWLRWNEDPEAAKLNKEKYSYVEENLIDRFFEDFDTVGMAFVQQVNTDCKLSKVLEHIESYPARVKWGGRPISSDPLMYAAILYMRTGSREKSLSILDRGLKDFSFEEPGLPWQVRRFKIFQERRRLIINNW